jgi:hypothetical protein
MNLVHMGSKDMNLRNAFRFAAAAGTFCAALAPHLAHAQSGPLTGSAGMDAMAQALSAQCPAAMAKIVVDDPTLRTVLSARPVDVGIVCGCARGQIVADARLRALMDMDQQTVLARIRTDRVRAYVILRTMHAMFSCLTPEIEAAAQAQAGEGL